ncbi:helix-hairpin-helix domain-containing protein [Candidatus Poribacteria bacterium]|jgi:competence ComEA-like helix-hairpin-helix protein|nr:helix-hairpin-helix domain-containing protein [Candidatus Poribacteria bacterium]MBT5531626.1 helix-hairpin-helix domain-containing protein [Candidatus Poribacteria bacterium]MBT5711541.1 helix-hairpin-helix domain-containing protein [Candidatus Poribacteria bacterium]MBT7096115.1 helix-hairpin-helix domain-containing protein [Candidatus Poribacteria bacterium]MBT7808821.1 helix-hairpin-helix domain-containing protein [Candidatus Poribacteria bacterium]
MRMSLPGAFTSGERSIIAALVVVTLVGSGVTVVKRLRPEWFMGEPTFIVEPRPERAPNGQWADGPTPDETFTPASEEHPIDLNTATPAALRTLPGIGVTLATRIIEYRIDNDGFDSIDELNEVKGIGDRRLEDIRRLVKIAPTDEPAGSPSR